MPLHERPVPFHSNYHYEELALIMWSHVWTQTWMPKICTDESIEALSMRNQHNRNDIMLVTMEITILNWLVTTNITSLCGLEHVSDV